MGARVRRGHGEPYMAPGATPTPPPPRGVAHPARRPPPAAPPPPPRPRGVAPPPAPPPGAGGPGCHDRRVTRPALLPVSAALTACLLLAGCGDGTASASSSATLTPDRTSGG